MRVVGVACVKNEADIIEAFVRHNLHYLDALLILDHGSTDRTSLILKQLGQENLPLTVVEDATLGKFQGEKMTQLMQQAARELAADWIILLDADELLKCEGDALSLPPASDEIAYWKVGYHTYCVSEQDNPATLNPVERMGSRLVREPFLDKSLEERRYFVKAIVPRKLALQEGAFVVQGNHHLLIANVDPPHRFWGGFVLAHYSLRSVGQYASKVAIVQLQHLYKSSPRAGADTFYVPHFEELKRDFDGFVRDFPTYRPAYLASVPDFDPSCVFDPLSYRGGPLRYTSPFSDMAQFTSNLLNHAEVLSRSLSEHAEIHDTKNQAAPLSVEVSCLQPLSSGQVQENKRLFLLEAVKQQTARFTWHEGTASTVQLRWQSVEALVEIIRLRFRSQGQGEWIEWCGETLRSKIQIKEGAVVANHDEYFTFFKGHDPAVITFDWPEDFFSGTDLEWEVDFWVEMNATRLASRLFQNRNFDQIIVAGARVNELNYRDRLKDVHLRELEQHIRLEQEGQQKLALIAEHLQKHAQKVEQKLRQRSTFWGSIRYQLYLLRNILR